VSISREQLMRYHDGELSEAEARLVETAIEQEPALVAELDAYSELGSFLRAWEQSNANKLASFDVSGSLTDRGTEGIAAWCRTYSMPSAARRATSATARSPARNSTPLT